MGRFLRVVLTVALITLVMGTGGTIALAQDTPSTLSGESFHQDVPTITSIDCTEASLGFTYLATGRATGPYPGTFTETGTVIFNRLSASFTIESPVGRVTGTKEANIGASCPFPVQCSGPAACARWGASYNTLPGGVPVFGDDYEATISTSAGTFADFGLFDAVFYRESPPDFYLNGFDSSFIAHTPLTPLAPATKDQCKRGGWAQYRLSLHEQTPRFKNQGQCVAYVQGGPNK